MLAYIVNSPQEVADRPVDGSPSARLEEQREVRLGMRVRFSVHQDDSCQSASVKGFGRRLAFESLRGTNPRAGSNQYGVLDFGRAVSISHGQAIGRRERG